MRKRPVSITIIGWVFILTGAGGFLSHFLSAFDHRTIQQGAAYITDHISELGLVLAISILGLIGGVFVLRGKNWARWLLVIWMGLHVGISVTHSWSEALMHAVIFIVLLCFLFSPKASAYFKN